MALSDKLSSALNVFLVALLIYNIFIKTADKSKNLELGVRQQNEITEAGRLLNSTGQLSELGWSRHYVKELDSKDAYPVLFGLNIFKALKFKRFELYCFFFADKLVQIAVANLHYASNAYIQVFDFEEKTFSSFTQDFYPIIDRDSFPQLADNIYNCDESSFKANKGVLEIEGSNALNNDICMTSLKVKAGNLLSGQLLSFRNTTHEDLFEILPVSENNRYFYYNMKSYNNPCAGKITLEGKELVLNKTNCLATMDYGRGVFEYKTSWYFGMGNGRLFDGTLFSLNFGSGLAAKTTQTIEDSFKINEKLFKLNPLEFIYDDRNLMNGVTLRTAKAFENETANAAEIIFQSYYTTTKGNNLLILMTDFRYIFGKFSGWVSDDEGKVVKFDNIPGFIEIAKLRW